MNVLFAIVNNKSMSK